MDGSTLGIEARVQRLEDIEAIRLLKLAYCDAADDGHDARRVASLFIPDGVWDSKGSGRFVGRRAIEEQFTRFAGAIGLSQHMVTNSAIDVNGDAATGRWYMLAAMTIKGDDRWTLVRYDEEYVRTAEGWRFAEMRIWLRASADSGIGWGAAL